ncbi:MAG: FixH family protein [Planctomycetota bacterium]
MTAAESTRPKARLRLTWPVIAVALLGGHATLILTAVSLAVSGTGRGVVPDYYQRAVAHDEHKAALAESERLGWRLDTTAGSWVDTRGRRHVEVRLTDAAGEPVTQLTVELAFTRRFDGRLVEATLSPVADRAGVYAGAVDLPAAGWHRMIAVAADAERRFIAEREVELRGSLAVARADEDGAM